MMSQRKDRDMTPATLTQLPLTRCGSTERNPNAGLGPTSQFQALNSHMTRGYHIGQCRMERLHYHRTCDCIGLMKSKSLGKASLVSRGCPGLNPLSIPAVWPPWPCAEVMSPPVTWRRSQGSLGLRVSSHWGWTCTWQGRGSSQRH